MSEQQRITEEELKSLHEAMGKSNQAKLVHSDLNTQAHLAQLQVLEAEKLLQEEQKQLQEKYGDITIDVSTGDYTLTEKE